MVLSTVAGSIIIFIYFYYYDLNISTPVERCVHFKMERWSGRVALVTGASSGIGAGIATALVKNGMIVIGVARDVDRIKVL